jgi:glycosyltransferase involved in cell wall biosynthesis
MRICLIGGIYGQGGARTEYVKITPETTLEEGFRAAGHEVTTLSHYDARDFSGFDVVHVHHLSYGALRMACDSSTTPYLFTAHDVSQMCGASLSTVRKLAYRYVFATADAIVSLSEREAEFQRQVYSLNGAHQAVIPNGIDPGMFYFSRENSAGNGRPWQLLFSGQLIPLKRCDVLLRAVARLTRNVDLSMVYQNPQLEAELKSLAADLGIQNRVHFLGKLRPDQLAEMYRVSDLLVLPSDTEALPSVITEAMMCGLPFMASAVGGVPEQAGGFGFLLQKRSVPDVAAAISEVLDRYADFAAASERMSKYATRTFSISSMVKRHLEMYQSVAGTPPRRKTLVLRGLRGFARAAVRRSGRRTAVPSGAQSKASVLERM